MKPINDAERERAAAMRAAVHAQMPEVIPIIREFVAEGLIDGWRNVTYCGPVDGGPKYHTVPATVWHGNTQPKRHAS